MTPVSSLQFAFLQQANHTDSKYLAETDVIQIDYYLNRAKDTVVGWLTAQDENNDTVRRHLAQLVKRDVLLSATKKTDILYEAKLPEDFYKHRSLYIMASKQGCDVKRKLLVHRAPSEKRQSALKNPNTNRFWDFEETFATEFYGGLNIDCESDLTYEVYLDYIRSVGDVAYVSGLKNGETYRTPAGEVLTTDQNLDLDGTFFHRMIVNLATLEVKRDYSNFPEYQTQRDFILSIDRT